jgi:hypothetical protein
MIFDISQKLSLTIIREEANLIKPDTGQDECAIAAFAFDLTLFSAHRLNNPLKEQFDGLFTIAVQIVLPPSAISITAPKFGGCLAPGSGASFEGAKWVRVR